MHIIHLGVVFLKAEKNCGAKMAAVGPFIKPPIQVDEVYSSSNENLANAFNSSRWLSKQR
jgi:hypothetical protein